MSEKKVRLSQEERSIIKNLIDQISYDKPKNIEAVLQSARLMAHELPKSILRYVCDFKYYETENVLTFCDLPYPDHDRCTTPYSFDELKIFPLTKDEIQLILLGSTIGDIFTWDSIQNGRLINHVFPIKDHHDKLISSNSSIDFGLHTEDAFTEYAGDYLLLFGYNNDQRIPTTVVYLEDVQLNQTLRTELFKNDFTIEHNIAHSISEHAVRTSILFGNFDTPYIRVNLNASKTIGLTSKAIESLEELKEILNKNRQYLFIESNQLSMIDNFRTVHGRDKYQPDFNGNDRWLKRLYVTRDLRKSRKYRKTTNDHVIETSKLS